MKFRTLQKNLAALTAAVIMLAGCGKTDTTEDQDSKGAAVSSSSAAETAAAITLPPKEDVSSEDESSTADSTSDSTDSNDTTDVPYTPAVWKVTSPSGNTMYMSGSMHALRSECVPLPDYVTEILDKSDTLAVECDISDNLKSTAAALKVMDKMNYPDGETIEDHLGKELWSEVASYFEAYGSDSGSYEKYQIWYVYSLLENLCLSDLGLESSIGYDMQLLNTAKEEGKEIYEVESAEFQIDMIAGFDENLLKTAIKGYSAENKELIEEKLMNMYTAWKSGDVDSVDTEEGFDESLYTEQELEDIAEFNRILVYDRNKGMADKAMELIDSGKSVFFVVGLAHFLGDKGIIASLEADGYTVERLEV